MNNLNIITQRRRLGQKVQRISPKLLVALEGKQDTNDQWRDEYDAQKYFKKSRQNFPAY